MPQNASAYGLFGLGVLGLLNGCQEAQPDPTEEPDPIPWDTPETPTLDSGRVTLHRLNNREFERTAQELLATEISVSDTLPADTIAFGFDNNAEAMTVSTLHLETIESAVDAMIADGLRAPIFIENTRYETEDEAWSGGTSTGEIGGFNSEIYGVSLYHGAAHRRYITVKHAGAYTLRVRACHNLYGEAGFTAPLEFRVNNEVLVTFTIVADENVAYGQHCKEDLQTYESEIELSEGEQEITVNSVDDGVVAVDWVELEGPLEATGELPPGRERLYICDPEPESGPDADCARQIVHNFMDEAWRRPVSASEVDDVMDVFTLATENGSDFHEGIAYAVKRTLLSPWFLFRVEIPAELEDSASQPLNAHELAARLSFFLWSHQPDPELRAAADDGSLLEPEVLAQQALRLLADPKAEALVDGFGAHWLGLPDLQIAAPDPTLFPSFDEPLRAAMDTELRELIHRALLGELSMVDLLTAESTWLEPRLAEHYGVQNTEAAYATVAGRTGGGVLTTAAFLTSTSNTTRTSPVRRGHWVVSNIMCEKPPPPPDGVEQDFDKSEGADSIPEQLAAHRANPACASCHDQLDPIGIALEPFDAVGLIRSTYPDGQPIESSGELKGVGKFTSVAELAEALAAQTRTHRCMVQKAFTYALGRTTQANDWPFIEPIEDRFVEGGHQFVDLMIGIVQSDPFRNHKGGE
jgi:hypothetical protein